MNRDWRLLLALAVALIPQNADAAKMLCRVTGKKDMGDYIEVFISCRAVDKPWELGDTIHVRCNPDCEFPKFKYVVQSPEGGGGSIPYGREPKIRSGPGSGGETIPGNNPVPVPSTRPYVRWETLHANSCQEFKAETDRLTAEAQAAAKLGQRYDGPTFARTRAFYTRREGHAETKEHVEGPGRYHPPGYKGLDPPRGQRSTKRWWTAKRTFFTDANVTIETPNPDSPPWPNPTNVEREAWRQVAENYYWHEMGHASQYESMQNRRFDEKAVGKTERDALENLDKAADKAIAAEDKKLMDGVHATYEIATNSGSTQFPGSPGIVCE